MSCSCLTDRTRECPLHGIGDRTKWTLKGVGAVEIRGTSPAFVWFSRVGVPDGDEDPQQKMARDDFKKKARRA